MSVGMSGTLDLLVLFFITMGWYDLYRRAWAILPSAFINLGISAVGTMIAALELAAAHHSRREMVLLGAGGIVPLALAIVQLIASLRLYSRIRPSAPPML